MQSAVAGPFKGKSCWFPRSTPPIVRPTPSKTEFNIPGSITIGLTKEQRQRQLMNVKIVALERSLNFAIEL